jgi:hypothetical protein
MRRNLFAIFTIAAVLSGVLAPIQSFAGPTATPGKSQGNGPCVTSGNTNSQAKSTKNTNKQCLAAPAAPTIGTATVINVNTISLQFTAGAANGSAITSYTITSSPSILLSYSGLTSPLTVTGTFIENQAYTFTMTATNAAGTSSSSAASNSVTPNVINVGQTGPGGGIVYYVSSSDFSVPGAPCSPNCRYLEVAPAGWSGTLTDPILPFSLPLYENSYVAATGTNIGSGYANTEAIVNQNGICNLVAECLYAAGAASAYRGGLKSDWYLPSQFESSKLAFVNFELVSLRPLLGLETPGDGYWNSWAGNPDAPSAATDTVFTLSPGSNNGYEAGYKSKSTPYYVRPIRAF